MERGGCRGSQAPAFRTPSQERVSTFPVCLPVREEGRSQSLAPSSLVVQVGLQSHDGDHGHKTKRRLLLGRKAMTNLDSTLGKQRPHSAN